MLNPDTTQEESIKKFLFESDGPSNFEIYVLVIGSGYSAAR
jgi:hypothetical protein